MYKKGKHSNKVLVGRFSNFITAIELFLEGANYSKSKRVRETPNVATKLGRSVSMTELCFQTRAIVGFKKTPKEWCETNFRENTKNLHWVRRLFTEGFLRIIHKK